MRTILRFFVVLTQNKNKRCNFGIFHCPLPTTECESSILYTSYQFPFFFLGRTVACISKNFIFPWVRRCFGTLLPPLQFLSSSILKGFLSSPLMKSFGNPNINHPHIYNFNTLHTLFLKG